MKNIIQSRILVIVFVYLIILFFLAVTGQGLAQSTIIVGDVNSEDSEIDYNSIQEAINNAEAFDDILIHHGSYEENIFIDKQGLNIKSYDLTKPAIIQARDNRKSVISLNSSDVKIESLIIKDALGSSYNDHIAGIYVNTNTSNNTLKNIKLINNDNGIIIKNSDYNHIINCNATKNQYRGMFVYQSNNNTIRDNIFNLNRYGLTLKESSKNDLEGNTFKENNGPGLSVFDSKENLIKSNISNNNNNHGIQLRNGSRHVLRNNKMDDNLLNFGSRGGIMDIDESNTVNDKPIYYMIDEHNQKIPPDAGCVYLINCSNIEIENIKSIHNSHAVFLKNTNGSLINNLEAADCGFGAINLVNSDNNTISNSKLLNSKYAIYLDCSSDNTINNNFIEDNSYGIWLRNISESNIIKNNKIVNSYYLFSPWGLDGDSNYIYMNDFKNFVEVYSSGNNFNENSLQFKAHCDVDYVYNNKKHQSYLGNYWDIHNKKDNNNDGIIDTSYYVSDTIQDAYPLIKSQESYSVDASAVDVTLRGVMMLLLDDRP